MSEPRYVLSWLISGSKRGVFCPAGGMTMQEAELAKERLYERARANGVEVKRVGVPSHTTTSIGASIVPYVFDIDNDPIAGLS